MLHLSYSYNLEFTLKDDNTNDGIVEVLEQLQQYLCTMTNPEDPDDIEYEC